MELPQMLDINAEHYGIKNVIITIRKDGEVVWINTETGCIFRICNVTGAVVVNDERKNPRAGL